jgi:hypothetical protein
VASGLGRAFALVDDAFDLKFGMLEIDEKAEIEAGNVEIAENLCNVSLGECLNHLEIHDDLGLNDQIRDQITDVMGFVADGEDSLLLEMDGSLGKFDADGPLVQSFVQSRAHLGMDGRSCTYNPSGKFGMRIQGGVERSHYFKISVFQRFSAFQR